jgi:hypothetical protein
LLRELRPSSRCEVVEGPGRLMAPTKLRSLAILTRPGGGLMWPRLTAAYQRALLASLHPGGATRTLRLTTGRAERLWISSRTLRALDAAPARRVA